MFRQFTAGIMSVTTTALAIFILLGLRGDIPAAQVTSDTPQEHPFKHLRIAIPTGYLHWFDDRDGLSGLEHDLLLDFARKHDLELELEIVSNTQQALALLTQGNVDLAAGTISQATATRNKLISTVSFMESRYQVVTSPGVDVIEHPNQLAATRVVVEAGSNIIPVLQSLTAGQPLTHWTISHTDSAEGLLAKLVNHEIDATITDTRSAMIMQHHYPQLQVGYEFPEVHPVVWTMSESLSARFGNALNDYLDNQMRHGTIAILNERYTDPASQQSYLDLVAFKDQVDTTLPRFRHMFIDAANKTDNDWRLIAALSYQESMWDPHAVSFTGVEGLMQLTEDTARHLKVDRNDPAQSIQGAARYINWLSERLPDQIEQPDRTWLALASYNLGPGHVDDAMSLAAERGLNPYRWRDLKLILPLLEDKELAKKTKFGSARGSEALVHVTRVRGFYQLLTRLENRAESSYQAAITNPIQPGPLVVAVTTEGSAVISTDADDVPSARTVVDTNTRSEDAASTKTTLASHEDLSTVADNSTISRQTPILFTEKPYRVGDGALLPDNGLFPIDQNQYSSFWLDQSLPPLTLSRINDDIMSSSDADSRAVPSNESARSENQSDQTTQGRN